MSKYNKRTIGYRNPVNPNDRSGVWSTNEIVDIDTGSSLVVGSKFKDIPDQWPEAATDPYYNTVIHQFSAEDPKYLNHMLKDQSSNHWDETLSSKTYLSQVVVANTGPKNLYSTHFYNQHYTVSDYSNIRFGTGNFTIEFWIKPERNNATQYYVMGKGGQAGVTSGTGWTIGISSTYRILFYDAVGNTTITSSTELVRDTWYHIAIVRSGTGANQLKIYQDGVLVATGTSSGNFTDTNALYIGKDRAATAGTGLQSRLFDIRIKGSAEYSAAFTRPSTLLDMTGAVFSIAGSESWHPTIPAIQPQGATIVPSGAQVIKIPDTPFTDTSSVEVGNGYSAISPQGTNSVNHKMAYYDTVVGNLNQRFGIGAFTIECWVFIGEYQYDLAICGKGTGALNAVGGTGWSVHINNSGFLMWSNNETSFTATTNRLYAGGWYHIAMVREGLGANEFKMYCNGQLCYTGTDATNYTTSEPLRIFTSRDEAYHAKYSWFSCLEISNIARYTANFTINNSTFVDTMATVDSNTTLSIFTSGTGMKARGPSTSWYNNGNDRYLAVTPRVEQMRSGGTSQPYSRHGHSVQLLYTTQEKLLLTSSQGDFNFGSDSFSIELWVNHSYHWSANTEARYIFDFRTYFNDAGMSLRYRQGMGYDIITGGQTILTIPALLVSRQWTHICVQRVNGNLAFYINGKLEGETRYTNAINAPSNIITIGNGSNPNLQNTTTLYGYVSDVRILRGLAAYANGTKNPQTFSVPTEPLTAITGCVILTACHPTFKDYSGRNNAVEAGGRNESNFTSAWNVYVSNLSPYQGKIWDETKNLRADAMDTNSGWDCREVGYISNNGIYPGLSWITRMKKNWTIEGWIFAHNVNPASPTSYTHLQSSTTVGHIGFEMRSHSTGSAASWGDVAFIFRNGDSNEYIIGTTGATGNLKPTSWNHYAIVYDSTKTNKVALFMNGRRVAVRAAFIGQTASNYHTYRLNAPGSSSGPVRISSTARYNNDTGSYTVPSQMWEYDSSTEFMPVIDGHFNDRAAASVQISYSLGAAPSYQYTKWGRGSMRFGNYRNETANTTAPDFIEFQAGNWPTRSDWVRFSDFTIEGWAAWQNSAIGGQSFKSTAPGACLIHLDNQLWLGIDTNGYWQLLYRSSTTTYRTLTSTKIIASASEGFDHFAVVRANGNFILYINGVEQGTMECNNYSTYVSNGPTVGANLDFQFTNPTYIGCAYSNIAANAWCGYLEDFRYSATLRYSTKVINNVATMCHIGTSVPALPTAPYPTR